MGNMGGMIFTNRRKTDRRAADKQKSSSQSRDLCSIQNGAWAPVFIP
jgi:hypothetical protein